MNAFGLFEAIHTADHGDTQTLVDSVMTAQVHLALVDEDLQIEEVMADKGYHAAATVEHRDVLGLRTYIPERESKHNATWTDKPADYQRCVTNNRRRIQRPKSKQLQRERSELCERTFAHVCDTGGMRSTWLRGLIDVTRWYLIAAAGHNLSQIMRSLFGIGKPRRLQDAALVSAVLRIRWRSPGLPTVLTAVLRDYSPEFIFAKQPGGYQTAEFHGLLGQRHNRLVLQLEKCISKVL